MGQPEIEKTSAISLLPVDYEPRLSLEESLGGRARRLWEQTFAEFAQLAGDAAIVPTGIGEAPEDNTGVKIWKYGDGAQVPSCLDLKRVLGHVPKLLFLTASTFTTEHVAGLRGVVEEYKEQGVEKVIVLLTALAHERQDHKFTAPDGSIIPQVTMVKVIIDMLADSQIDGGILVQPHSLRPVEFALQRGFPLLPIDAFKFMVERAELKKVENPFVLGPDKGRNDEARMLAAYLHCPLGSAEKIRDRLNDGKPDVQIPDEILAYIRDHAANVIVFDDEIREGGTTGDIADKLEGYANSLTVCAVKPIFAQKTDANGNGRGEKPITAIDHLNKPIITNIIVTDAVHPLTDASPLGEKLTVLRLGPELVVLARYLGHHLVEPDNPNWLRDPKETGTLLRLDLSIEQTE